LKYSIIIPTLNEEKLLPNLLELLSQKELKKKFDYEIVVSDGGSNDCTISVASKYADIVKIHTKPFRQNIAIGRNCGAQSANGDILIFINADVKISGINYFFDFLNSKFYNSSYLAMACNVKVFPEEEIFADKIFHTFYNTYFRILNNMGVGMGRGECQVIRKDVFNKLCGYNEKLAAGEDFDLFKKIRKYGKILFATEICVYESPRRFRKFGYRGVTFSWMKNSLSVIFRNKSLSKEWEQVR
jgi:glycosyltransferase involved in cell wall biosynthesis